SKARERLLEAMDDGVVPETRVRSGEILGWLGDTRNLKEFVKILGGKHELEIGPIDIKPFEINKYPVTNSWFEEFINADGYKNKEFWSKEGLRWLAHTRAEHPALWNERKWNCPNSPVVGVSWYEAYAFTKWLSAVDNNGFEYRFLNENEWEAVAAGLEGREYPWGNEWDKNKCNNGEIELRKTSPVGIFKEGNTPDNISDLSGNVWEWTTSDYHSKNSLNDFTFDEDIQKLYEENFSKYLSKLGEKNRQLPVLRGGSWYYVSRWCRCAYRDSGGPVIRSGSIGFRCARTLTL
ncbi:MAG: formylglycine-generating enzyme family protein, partial [Deltaproteobacteria bacterium]|nr:formylglycine-generating enzyme family protein [Deltaproteobacteria bacterium]